MRVNSPLKDVYYKYTVDKIIFPGWKIVKGYDRENSIYENISKLKKKFDIDYNVIEAHPTIKYSKTRYNEATLIKALEKQGIGRPSTFSSLVSKIQEREYVKRENVEGVEYKSN